MIKKIIQITRDTYCLLKDLGTIGYPLDKITFSILQHSQYIPNILYLRSNIREINSKGIICIKL